MALIERTETSKVEFVGPFRHLQIREDAVIEKDGVEISRSPHRQVFIPGADVTNLSDEIQGMCAIMWTPAVIAAFQARDQND